MIKIPEKQENERFLRRLSLGLIKRHKYTYHKKTDKMRFFKADDSIFDIISKSITIAVAFVGTFTYFHTIYPVFTKEKELKETKENLIQLDKEYNQKKIVLTNTNNELSEKEAKLTRLEKTLEAKTIELDSIRFKYQTIQEELVRTKSDAIKAYLYKQMSEVVNEDIHQVYTNILNTNKPFRVKDYAIKIAKKGMKESDKKSNEYKANEILLEFAQTKLTDNSTFNEIFNIIAFYYSNYEIKNN